MKLVVKDSVHQNDALVSKQRRIESLKAAWKNREDYTNGLFGTPIHNTWRAMNYTIKGKKAGCAWESFKDFNNDMGNTWQPGYRIARVDKSAPFSKENCFWVDPKFLPQTKDTLVKITHDGQTLTIKEWAVRIGNSPEGIRQRYHRFKIEDGYTIKDILYGKQSKKKKWKREDKVNIRVSKLLSTYKHKDIKRGQQFDLDHKWFTENIIPKPCHYCGSHERIGADRIDNSKGHLKSNVVPACYVCNTIRGDRFTVEEMMIIGESISKINLLRK